MEFRGQPVVHCPGHEDANRELTRRFTLDHRVSERTMAGIRGPHAVPPPITFGDDPVEAGEVLAEWPAEEATLLWKTVRTMRLWAEISEGERPRTFSDDAFDRRIELISSSEVRPRLRTVLCEAAEVLRDDSVSSDALASTCARIGEFAEQFGALGTALEYYQAAALLNRSDARYPRAVGLVARRKGEIPRAETWFREAIRRGRSAEDWVGYCWSWIGLGKVFMLRGNYPSARAAFSRALRRARRQRKRLLVAAAHHDMVALAVVSGRRNDLFRHAQSALKAYGRGHERLPVLAHDVAVFLMREGYFEAALEMFSANRMEHLGLTEKLARAASMARAAGALGKASEFEAAWQDASTLLDVVQDADVMSSAMLALARGAASLGKVERARSLAREAHTLAIKRGESARALDAESVLDSLVTADAGRGVVDPKLVTTPPRVASIARTVGEYLEPRAI